MAARKKGATKAPPPPKRPTPKRQEEPDYNAAKFGSRAEQEAFEEMAWALFGQVS